MNLFVNPSSHSPLVNMHILIMGSLLLLFLWYLKGALSFLLIIIFHDCHIQMVCFQALMVAMNSHGYFCKVNNNDNYFHCTFQGLGKTLQCITLIWTLLVRTMN